MENQKKKLRLEDIKVESFVTSSLNDSRTIKGGFESFTCGDKTPGEFSALGGVACDDSWTCPISEDGPTCNLPSAGICVSRDFPDWCLDPSGGYSDGCNTPAYNCT